MAKPDEGHILTEKALAELEKKIASVYGEAAKEMQTTIDEYFSSFAKRDEEMKSLIGSEVNGKEWTKEDYKKWRLNQIGRGERLEALRDKIAERVTEANETAVAYVNDATPGIYSLNRNYTAYTIEQVSPNADFTLWDEQTVKRLITESPDLMPYYPKKMALKRGIDLEYGKKQIAASITSSILQGKSIKHIADDLQTRIITMDRASAIRTARTAVTGAQNAGRMDSYKAAEGMGIKLKKQWLATLDNRTRHAHAMLDGQTVDVDKPFEVDGHQIMYPGDRSAPGYLVYNCRCTTIAVLPDVDTSDAQRWAIDPETGERTLVSDMTYQEWAGWKKQAASYKDMPQGYRRQFMAQQQEKEIFRFQPAKTQQEAVDYMSRITKNGAVKIGEGVTIEQENAINMALTDVHNRYGVKLDIRSVTHANGNYQAAYNPQKKSLLVKGGKATWERNAQKLYASGFLASGDTYQVFYHELGHAMWEELPRTAQSSIETLYKKYTHEAYTQWREMGGASSGKGQADVFQQYLSRYGHQDKYEFFAECFSQIMTDYDGEAAFDVGEILDEVFTS